MSHPTRQPDSSGGEDIPLQIHGGTCENGDAPHDPSSHGRKFAINKHLSSLRQGITSCCPPDPYHRKLAIASIICGLSCVGACALINSVKAEEREQHDPEKAEVYRNKAKWRAITSIALGVAIPILLVVLVIFGSYILTLID